MQKEKRSIPHIINCSLLIIVTAITLLSLIRAVFKPEDIEQYENRSANKVPPLTLTSYLDGSFQTGMEDALGDQVFLSTTAKIYYNLIDTNISANCVYGLLKQEDHYTKYKDISIFNDCLTYSPKPLSEIKTDLDKKIKNINNVINQNPELDFYIYYVKKDTDINFETNEQMGCFEYVRDNLKLSKDHILCNSINNYDDFEKNFYRTDHHWKYTGSYSAYTQLVDAMNLNNPLKPIEEVDLGYQHSGSKAMGVGGASFFKEEFKAYRFDYPEYDITYEGHAQDDYGLQDAYFAHQPGNITYGDFYGWDGAEIIFDNHKDNLENILIIGESYDNAILKLLASHFNETYSIDLRHYETIMGKPFEFSKYVKEHNISKVLLIGNMDYFSLEEFMLRG